MGPFSKVRLLPSLRKPENGAPRIPVPGLLPPDRFREHLHTERTRVDRSQSSFSLIVFTLEGVEGAIQLREAEELFIDVLFARTRACDAKGWHGSHPALILPYTAKSQAHVLIEPLTQLFHERVRTTAKLAEARFSCVVYGYPEDAPSGVSPF